MAKIRKVSASLIDEPKASVRQLSPAHAARQAREAQFRQLVAGLAAPDQVFLVTPSDGEKTSTIRTGLQKVVRDLGRERDLIVRKHEDGFLVALTTPEREASRRGRRPKGASA